MSLPIPTELPEPPKIFGDDCLDCFPAGQTPKHKTVFFSDIVDCNPDEPAGHGALPNILILEQLEDTPCIYVGWHLEIWHSHYWLDISNNSKLNLLYSTLSYFLNTKAQPCEKVFESELSCSNSDPGGSGGTAFVPNHQVTVPLKDDREAFQIANSYNFSPPRLNYRTPGLELEPGEYEPDLKPAAENRCIKLLHNSDATSILLKHKPNKTYG